MSKKMTWYDAALQAATARFLGRVKYYKRLLDRGDRRNRAGSSGSSRGGWSSDGPERKCKRMEKEVQGFCSQIHKTIFWTHDMRSGC